MGPIYIRPGEYAYLPALQVVSYFVEEEGYIVWYADSEVVTAILYPPVSFLFHLADGRLKRLGLGKLVCVYRYP